MIDEIYLVAAVNIKKRYLELVTDIDKYHNRAKKTLEKLDQSLKEIQNIQERMKLDAKDKKMDSNGVLNNMFTIIQEIEDEGKSLENYINPLNKEIEKLAVEESKLYEMICDKHKDLSEEQIVELVKKRLEKENLS